MTPVWQYCPLCSHIWKQQRRLPVVKAAAATAKALAPRATRNFVVKRRRYGLQKH